MPPKVARDAKRAKLLHVVSNTGLPSRKLQKVFAALRDFPELLDEPTSRDQLDEAYHYIFEKCQAKPITLPLIDGGSFTWEILHIGKTLDYLCSEVRGFADLLGRLIVEHPPSAFSPWNLIMYCDEATPGSGIRLDHRRKTMCVYVSIVEYGPVLTKHEAMWIPVALLRSNIISTVVGGWGRIIRDLMLEWLSGTESLRFGYFLKQLGAVLYFQLGFYVADEDALSQIWSTKGAGGVFPCFECYNICGVGSKSAVNPDEGGAGFVVDIGCTDPDRFCLKDDAGLWRNADELTRLASLPNKAALEKKQIKYGLNHNPHGLLQCLELRPVVKPISVQRHDACHILWSNGMVKTELNMLLPLLLEVGMTFEIMREYIGSGWKKPAYLHDDAGKHAFGKVRTKYWAKTWQLSFFASELMTVCPILAHLLWVTQRIRAALPLVVDSFVKLAKLSRTVAKGKLAGGHITADELAAALRSHGDAFKTAYEGEGVKPKFHWARKLVKQFIIDGYIQDCYCMERKHALSKAAAEATDNTGTYEKTIQSRALSLHAGQLKQFNFFDGLHQGDWSPETALLIGAETATISTQLRLDGTTYTKGDVVFIRDTPFEIQGSCAFTEMGNVLSRFGMFLFAFDLIGEISPLASLWERLDGEMHFVVVDSMEKLRLSPHWMVRVDGRYLVFD